MKKIGNINNIPIVQGRNNEIKNQIKAEINIDGTLSFKKRNSLGELTPLTYIDVQGNNAKSRRKVGELFNKPLISSSTHLLKKKEILVQKSNEGIILGIRVNNGIKIISKNDSQPEYLCFTSTGDSTISMKQTGTPNKSANKVIQYKLNNGRWQTWDMSAVTLADGDKMYIKSDDEIPVSESDEIYKQFVITGSIAASGNIMSLLNFSTTLPYYAFCMMFLDCASLTAAPELPATTLAPNCYDNMFNNCTSLVQAPALPATTLADSCYTYMFNECTSLTAAPELPATTLALGCYTYMFNGCTSLVQAPALPATTLTISCYNRMFYSCTSLTTAPELPATKLREYCYYSMFNGCTSLTAAPELPATTLSDGCYYAMFDSCTSLTSAPTILPATILAVNCYKDMFKNCTSLVQAPALPATTLTNRCYQQMFINCSNLNYVKAMFTDISAPYCLTDWLTNVSPTGTFDKSKDATWTNEQAGIPAGWTVVVEGSAIPDPGPVHEDYLCFTSTGDSTVAMSQEGTPTDISKGKVIQYKINNGEWQTWDLSAVTLADGDKMYLKSDDEIPINEAYNIYKVFVMSGSIAASGNIMSLLNFSDTLTDYAFCKMFDHCSSLTQPPTLPATTLSSYCYKDMFNGCTSLVQPPTLPATTLADYCYSRMFMHCSSLTTAPELPATTLAYTCYNNMFSRCTSLTAAPALPATTLTDYCYEDMFYGCTSLVTAPELHATTLSNGCYRRMFNDCTSLINAPALPATTLSSYCYSKMFYGCTSLTTAPELPATNMKMSCYSNMFQGCSKLNYVKAMFTDISAQDCLIDWLTNVSPTGTFVKNAAATWTNEQAEIPAGWTVQTA